MSLAAMLLEAPERLEGRLVKNFKRTCLACKDNATSWYHLCGMHATLTRSIIDPTYHDYIKRSYDEAKAREARYLEALPTIERIETGREWLRANEDSPKYQAGWNKLENLIASLPPDMRAFTLAKARGIITFTSAQAAYYRAQDALIESWSDRIEEYLDESYTPPPDD